MSALAAGGGVPPAAGSLSHRQILTIFAGLMIGMFLAALDHTIVATAIRAIADDLHELSLQAWATTAYLITATISTPLYGKLSDLYGRKPLFLVARGGARHPDGAEPVESLQPAATPVVVPAEAPVVAHAAAGAAGARPDERPDDELRGRLRAMLPDPQRAVAIVAEAESARNDVRRASGRPQAAVAELNWRRGCAGTRCRPAGPIGA